MSDTILNPNTITDTASGWNNDNNAKVVDGVGASAIALVQEADTTTLLATSFGYTLPLGEILTGITLTIRAKYAGLGDNIHIWDKTIQMMYNGSPIGSNLAKTEEITTNYADYVYTVPITGLDENTIEHSTFGVAIVYRGYDHSIPAFGAAPNIDGITLTFASLKQGTTNKYMTNLAIGSQIFVGTPFEGHVR